MSHARRVRVARAETAATVVAVVALAVLLWGGYARHWAWTGFGDNDHLWDWLNLLALPLALALLPVWLRRRDRLGAPRRRALGVLLGAFVGLVLAGYLVPLLWTGFVGNTLWDWLSLLVLPAAAATAVFWREGRRELRPRHRLALAVVAVALVAAVTGGYLGHWSWTGVSGRPLWDWLQLLIAPLVLPTVLLPVAASWMEEAAEEEAQAGAGAPIPPGARTGLRSLAVLSAGGVLAVILVPHHAEAGSRRPPCAAPPAATVVADGSARVVRGDGRLVACPAGGRAVTLGRAGPAGPRLVRLAAGRVAFVVDRCRSRGDCVSRVEVVRLGADRAPFARLTFRGTAGAGGLYMGPRGAVAVMLRAGCPGGGTCRGGRLYVQDTGGRRLVASGAALDPASLAGQGRWVYFSRRGAPASLRLRA